MLRIKKRIWLILAVFCCVFLGIVKSDKIQAQSFLDNMDYLPMTTMGAEPNVQFNIGDFWRSKIIFYNPCDGVNSDSTNTNVSSGGCAKLAQLRQAMWNEASDEDKGRFANMMKTENPGLAVVEGYMNQVLAVSDGSLHDWLGGQCKGFAPKHAYDCDISIDIPSNYQTWIDKALAGSNVTNVATGNAYYIGDAKIAEGHLTCLWEHDDGEDGGHCVNIDYSKSPYNEPGQCAAYYEAAKKDGAKMKEPIECWGWDNTKKWSSSMASQCAGSSSVGATVAAEALEAEKEGAAAGAASSAGSASSKGATSGLGGGSANWKDGWLVEGSIPGMKKQDVNDKNDLNESVYEVGSYVTDDNKPNKILLHATEGKTNGYDAYPSGNKYPAHFTVDLKKKEGYQHFSIYQPSLAIKSYDQYGPIQIEIVGYDAKEEGYTEEYDLQKMEDEDWEYLVKLLKAISAETGIPLKSSVDWTKESRMSKKDFLKYEGVLGHMHAPKPNDHNDPGDIWKYIEGALGTTGCELNGDTNSISGAKNAEKQANEVGKMTVKDVKAVFENYGDLAYRTGQAYSIPWIGILAQAMNESPTGPKNNFWGIGPGKNYSNLAEGFEAYGKTTQADRYKNAVKEEDPYEYIKKLGEGGWCEGGYSSDWLKGTKSIIKELTEFIESEEGKQVVAQFGAADCTDGIDECLLEGSEDSSEFGSDSEKILAAVQEIIDLANKNGAGYLYGGGRSISHFKDVRDKGAFNRIDCTGFASMVYWWVYGDEFKSTDIFSSSSIIDGMSSYKEVSRSEVRPGDIFAYKTPKGHGGIVIEVKNGKVTKIAETNGREGRKGENKTLGYSSGNDFSIRNINGDAGHFYRWKGAN